MVPFFLNSVTKFVFLNNDDIAWPLCDSFKVSSNQPEEFHPESKQAQSKVTSFLQSCKLNCQGKYWL